MDTLNALRNALANFLAFLPQLVFFLLILIVGFIIAKVLTKVIAKLLTKVGFNKLVERGGLKIDAATAAGKVIFYTLMLFVASAAFGVFASSSPRRSPQAPRGSSRTAWAACPTARPWPTWRPG
jgi:E3 ubiquitin-protein ligase DOA10